MLRLGGGGGAAGGIFDGAPVTGIFGGNGGAIACRATGIEWLALTSRLLGGGSGTAALEGAGGGVVCLSPVKGGGTPNRCFGAPSSVSGVFGGLGGGGGPAGAVAAADAGRFLNGGAGALMCANLPASANGGGALNLGRGGDGVRGGVACLGGEGAEGASGRLLRGAGGAGGGPLREAMVLPVF